MAVVGPEVSRRCSWGWGTYGLNREVPAVLARPPWNVPWHWILKAWRSLVLGLWAVGVMRHVLTLWWRGPRLAWLLVVAMGLASLAVSHTSQGSVWRLPGTQFRSTITGRCMVPTPSGGRWRPRRSCSGCQPQWAWGWLRTLAGRHRIGRAREWPRGPCLAGQPSTDLGDSVRLRGSAWGSPWAPRGWRSPARPCTPRFAKPWVCPL